jgi:hypothetical protein
MDIEIYGKQPGITNCDMNCSGIVGLIAYGAQDQYIKATEINDVDSQLFFKKCNNKHENFGMNVVGSHADDPNVDFNKKLIFSNNNKKGDILDHTFIKIKLRGLPKGYHYKNMLVYNIIDSASIEIGGQPINRINDKYMYIQDLINDNVPEKSRYMHISNNEKDLIEWSEDDIELYIPINIINIQIPVLIMYDVKFIVKLKHPSEFIIGYDNSLKDILRGIELYNNYIYLDTSFRRHLTHGLSNVDQSKNNEKSIYYTDRFIIKQLQFTGKEKISNIKEKIRLNFNHPVSSLYFFITDENNDIVSGLKFDASILMNGSCIVCENSNYYCKFLPRKYLKLKNGLPDGIYFYNFCLNPLETSQSGSINYSKIDFSSIDINFKNLEKYSSKNLYISVYAETIQWLRIISGMAGLAFSK